MHCVCDGSGGGLSFYLHGCLHVSYQHVYACVQSMSLCLSVRVCVRARLCVSGALTSFPTGRTVPVSLG